MQDASALMAQFLAQVSHALIGLVHQDQRIQVHGGTCGDSSIVVKFVHEGMIAATETSAPASGGDAMRTQRECSRADDSNRFPGAPANSGPILSGHSRRLRPRKHRLAAVG